MTSARGIAIREFLQKNVLNRKVSVQSEEKLDNEGLEIEFARTLSVTDLQAVEHGFSFRRVATVRQKNSDLDAAGAKTGRTFAHDREIVSQTTVTERISTGEMLGVSVFVSSTVPQCNAGTADAVRMWLDGDVLFMEEQTVGYVDIYSKGGVLKPGRQTIVWQFRADAGKLVVHEETTAVQFDPSTRQPTGSILKVSGVSREQ
jgi:hypothetical protein